MLGLKVRAAQRQFFDRAIVMKSADKKTRAVLSKFGSFVRRTAKGLIRKAKKASRPGSPPHSHGPGLLKKFIYFVYDKAKNSVIIGPARINGTVSSTCPEALEHGGTSTVITGGKRNRRVKKIRIQARPYIGPAASKELPKIAAMWAEVRS